MKPRRADLLRGLKGVGLSVSDKCLGLAENLARPLPGAEVAALPEDRAQQDPTAATNKAP
jgi:hypothetical protein